MYWGAHWHPYVPVSCRVPHQVVSLQPLSPAGALPETQGQGRRESAGKCVLGRGLVPAGHQAGDSFRWPGCNAATLGPVPVQLRKACRAPPGAGAPPPVSVPAEVGLGFLLPTPLLLLAHLCLPLSVPMCPALFPGTLSLHPGRPVSPATLSSGSPALSAVWPSGRPCLAPRAPFSVLCLSLFISQVLGPFRPVFSSVCFCSVSSRSSSIPVPVSLGSPLSRPFPGAVLPVSLCLGSSLSPLEYFSWSLSLSLCLSPCHPCSS